MIRLNSFIAKAGLCSRRKADILISQGKIKVNGKVVKQLGLQIDLSKDVVEYNSKILKIKERNTYVLLNKPRGYITTSRDERGRKTVIDLLSPDLKNKRLFPVGRLDKNTTGLLILTDDGELANKLMHPRNEIKKTYSVILNKPLQIENVKTLTDGITDEGELLRAKSVKRKGTEKVEVILTEGKKREIKRMFRKIGYFTREIKRIKYAFLSLGTLKEGEYRELTDNELKGLKNL
jgi:23S rRNA pseudouridine2605 synthase